MSKSSLLSKFGIPHNALLRIAAVGLLSFVVALASGRFSNAIDPGDSLTWWLYFLLLYVGSECLVLAIRKTQRLPRGRSK